MNKLPRTTSDAHGPLAADISTERLIPSSALTSGRGSLAKLDRLFRGFADPTRLRILNVLAAGELCVCDIVDLLDLPQPTVSRHLAYLRRSGLVEATRSWRFAHYRLADSHSPVQQNLLACVRSCFAGIPSLDADRAAAEACVIQRATDPC